MRHIVQYIYGIVFKRIFWNNPAAVTIPDANAAESCSFLEMTNFAVLFTPNYLMITTPLRMLTVKHAPFKWDAYCQQVFITLTNTPSKSPAISYFDPSKETKLILDGSKKTRILSIVAQEVSRTQQYNILRYDSRPTTQQK